MPPSGLQNLVGDVSELAQGLVLLAEHLVADVHVVLGDIQGLQEPERRCGQLLLSLLHPTHHLDERLARMQQHAPRADHVLGPGGL